jgi:hypothetical protein
VNKAHSSVRCSNGYVDVSLSATCQIFVGPSRLQEFLNKPWRRQPQRITAGVVGCPGLQFVPWHCFKLHSEGFEFRAAELFEWRRTTVWDAAALTTYYALFVVILRTPAAH